MIKGAGQAVKPDNLTVTLNDSHDGGEPKLVAIVKDIQDDDPYAGSVSIARNIFLEGLLPGDNQAVHKVLLGHKYTQWITLFDDQADDDYDGALGLEDEEEPRIQFEFVLNEVKIPSHRQPEKAEKKKEKVEKKKDTKSYMQPLKKNQEKRDKSAEK